MAQVERRKFPRLDDSVPVVYRLLGRNSTPYIQSLHQEFFNACTINLSTAGVCIRVDRVLEEDTILALTLNFRDVHEEVFSIGKVAWCEESSQRGSFIAGIEFVAVKAGYPDRDGQEKARALVEKHCIAAPT